MLTSKQSVIWFAILIVAFAVSSCTAGPAVEAPATPTTSPTQPPVTPDPTTTPTPGTTPEASPFVADLPSNAATEFDTDFSKHSVPYDEISTVLSKDRIPALDDPQFIGIEEADEWLSGKEPVLAVEIKGEARAYPVQILMWHEIVNDEVQGVPVAATYCPLCNTGIVFDRSVEASSEAGGERVLDFGTTGRLRFSNLVMYDRQTESWWQQASGKAIAGTLTGQELTIIPSSLISWEDFESEHPEGRVLSRETGWDRDYGQNPYTGYDDPSRSPFLYSGPETPDALPQVARVLGVELNGEAVAYPYEQLRKEGVVNDTVGGEPIAVFWRPGTASALDASEIAEGDDVGAANAFSRELDGQAGLDGTPLTFSFEDGRIVDEQTGTEWSILGEGVSGSLEGHQLEPVVSVNHFWFSWSAFNPEARLYDPESAEATPQEGAGDPEVALEADFEVTLYQGTEALGGSSVAFSEVLAEGKPVVLNFWAGLCPICRNELPDLQEAYETYGDRVLFVGVDVGPFVGLVRERMAAP